MNEAFQRDLQHLAFKKLMKPKRWLKQIEFINHLILFNNLIISVLAEQQGGKSSFGQLLQEALDAQIKTLPLSMHASMSCADIINMLAQSFHLRCSEQMDISSIIQQINERRAHVLLLIDDAHHLPETFIKEVLLALKNQEDGNYFHLCLLTDYSMAASINALNASFFANRVHLLELEKLDEEESRVYFNQLSEKPLTPAQWSQFYTLTKGNLSQMNQQVAAFLASCDKKVVAKSGILKPLLFSFASVVVSLTVGWMVSKPTIRIEQPTSALESYVASWQDNAMQELLMRALAKQQDLDAPAQIENEAPLKEAIKPYTIQLVASPDKTDLQRYQKRNQKFHETMRLSQYQEKEGIWYVLTVGEFSSVSDALQKIEELPPELTKLNPWVRPVATLATV